MKAQVIVAKCTPVGDTVYGERLVDHMYSSVDDAMSQGRVNIASGVCVIIRPQYNEVDAEGKRFFREWRSFNGSQFKECRFDF